MIAFGQTRRQMILVSAVAVVDISVAVGIAVATVTVSMTAAVITIVVGAVIVVTVLVMAVIFHPRDSGECRSMGSLPQRPSPSLKKTDLPQLIQAEVSRP